MTWHSPAKYWDIPVPLRTDFPAQEYHDHSKDFPKDDNISAGSVLSRISSLVWAITYLLFVFVLKTFINHHFFGSQECRDLWKMQQKNNAWLSHFYDCLEMESYQQEDIKEPQEITGILWDSIPLRLEWGNGGRQRGFYFINYYLHTHTHPTTSCLKI